MKKQIQISLLILALSPAFTALAKAPEQITKRNQMLKKPATLDLNLTRDKRFALFQEAYAKAQTLFIHGQWQELDKYLTESEKTRDKTARGDLGITSSTIVDSIYNGLEEARTNNNFEEQLKKIDQWQKACPKSIYTLVIKGLILRNWAWEARGSGWASSVTDQGENLKNERLALAKQALNECPTNSRPFHWYLAMQDIALGSNPSKEELYELCASAAKAYPQQVRHYFKQAYSLLPRWHGDDGEWERFARESADKVGGTDGDVLYARIVWYVHKAYSNEIKDVTLDTTRLERGLKELSKRFPGDLAPSAELAMLSLTLGEKEKAKVQFAKLGANVPTSVFKGKYAYYKAWENLYGSKEQSETEEDE
jgi:hypothetical protein